MDAHAVIAVLHPAHGAVKLVDRLEQPVAQPPRAHKAQQQAQNPHHRRNKVDRADGLCRKGVRLLQNQRYVRAAAAADIVAAVLFPAGQRRAGEQLPTQSLTRSLAARRLRGVNHPPRPVDEQQIVRPAQERREKRAEIFIRHAKDHIAQHAALMRRHRARAGKAVILRPQGRTARMPRGIQRTPAGIPVRRQDGRRRIKASALSITDIKICILAHRDRIPREDLVERTGILSPAAQRAARGRASGQRLRRIRAAGEQLVEPRSQHAHLLPRLRGLKPLAAHNHHPRHQQVAQQQRHKRPLSCA